MSSEDLKHLNHRALLYSFIKIEATGCKATTHLSESHGPTKAGESLAILSDGFKRAREAMLSKGFF